MTTKVIVITGASGFLGSALTVELAKNFNVYAIDIRKPSIKLKEKTPGVNWNILDISDKKATIDLFEKIFQRYGRIDFVIHLAAFWHFGTDYAIEYIKTNIEGTENIIDCCREKNCRRLIFASTLSVLSETAKDEQLLEESNARSSLPYAVSKINCESMIVDASSSIPVAIVRIGSVFSEWCELPPLYSLIHHWSKRSFIGRIIPGKGHTGFPYIHRNDLVCLIIKIIDKNSKLNKCQWILASSSKTTTHNDIYPEIRKYMGVSKKNSPLFLPIWFVRAVLIFKFFLSRHWELKFLKFEII
ncbi:NAD-dependent epimerase/dehydratase family protein [Spirochaetota bacterium]